MAYDPKVINDIAAELDRAGASQRVRKAAFEAPIVESGVRNLNYGDRDSLGPYQQRSSQGWAHARDPRLAARDFITEAVKLNATGKYKSAGQLAQAVQRSAFPGRYDAVGGQADSILASLGGGGSSQPQPQAQTSSLGAVPSAPQSLGAGQGSDFTSLLGSLLAKPQPAQPSSTPIQAPSFSAAAPMPGGFHPLLASSAPAQAAQSPVSDALSLVSALGGTGPSLSTPTASATADGPQMAPASQGGKNPPGALANDLITEANKIDAAHVPYLWGGGHGGKIPANAKVTPLDCSGAVSRVLGINPRVASQFKTWGQPGEGKGVTIYAKDDHVIMKINGHFFGTSRTNPGGGAGWIPQAAISKQYLSQFTARHAPGQ